MNWLKSAHAWPGGRGLAVLALTFTLALSGACSTSSNTNDQAVEDEVIGNPPAAEDDPFFVEKMPGEAVEAAPSGSIGEEIAEDEQVAARAPRPDSSPDDPDKLSSGSQASGKQAPDQPQCFSCVRICPTDGDCDQAKDDVICGWGVHQTADEAKRMAQAECDATLDMARQMPVWSEIAGECPAATCR